MSMTATNFGMLVAFTWNDPLIDLLLPLISLRIINSYIVKALASNFGGISWDNFVPNVGLVQYIQLFISCIGDEQHARCASLHHEY